MTSLSRTYRLNVQTTAVSRIAVCRVCCRATPVQWYLIHPPATALAKGTQMPVESTSAPSESASVSASRENMVANSRLSGLPCAMVLWAKVRTMKRKMEIQKSMKKPCAAS